MYYSFQGEGTVYDVPYCEQLLDFGYSASIKEKNKVFLWVGKTDIFNCRIWEFLWFWFATYMYEDDQDCGLKYAINKSIVLLFKIDWFVILSES